MTTDMWGFPPWEGQGTQAVLSHVPELQIFVSPLPSAKTACQYRRMKFAAAIQRVLCVFAMLGVILGPVSIGMAETAMASSGVMSMDAMPGMSMPEAMPDCLKEQSQKFDCGKNCPLALICTTAIFAQMPNDQRWSVSVQWTSHRYDLMPASQLTSALVEPPARPPKA